MSVDNVGAAAGMGTAAPESLTFHVEPSSPDATSTRMLDAVLRYATEGLHVFPISDDSKEPITSHGHLDATTSEPQIRAWWTQHPNARIGVHLRASGLIAVDVDVADGKRGDLTFAALEREHGVLPRSNHQRSGRGGEHVILRDPSPGPAGWTRTQETGGRARGKLGPGVDLKINGYIVLAPSGSYRWLARDLANIAEVPAAWVELMRKRDDELSTAAGVESWAVSTGALDESAAAALREELRALPPRGSGDAATMRAVKLVHHDYGLSVDDGAAFLSEWNASCGKPHSCSELARQVERIAAKVGDDAPRGWRLDARDLDEVLANLSPDAESVATPRRRLSQLVGAVARSDRPPLRRYASGLPELDALIGGGITTRQLLVLAAPPGAGKSALAVSIARHVQDTIPVLYCSTELESDEIAARVAAPILETPWTVVVGGLVAPGEVASALDGLRIAVIGSDDLPRGDAALDAIDREVEAMTAEHGVPPLVIIDYIQDLARGADERAVRGKIGDLATELRALAQRRDCPLIGVSSVSRSHYGGKREDEMRAANDPSVYLAAAKESGDVDYAAAVVIYVDVVREPGAASSVARLAVAKSRHGTTGYVGARFTGATGAWSPGTDELVEASERRQAHASASRDAQDDEVMLGAVMQQASAQQYLTARGWRQQGVLAERRAEAAIGRLVRTRSIALHDHHPVTGATGRGNGYVVPVPPPSDPGVVQPIVLTILGS